MRISDWSSDVCSSDLLDLGGRQFSVMTASSIAAAQEWIPSSLALYPDLHRLWVAGSDDEAAQLNELGIEAVVSSDESHGLDAAQALLTAFGIAPDAVSAWADRQRARIASPLEIGRAACRERGCQDV